MLPERQLGLDPILEHDQPSLAKPRYLALRELLVGEVRERSAAPQRECGPEAFARDLGIALRERVTTAARELVEPVGIDLIRFDRERVPAPTSDQEPIAELLAQVRDVDLDRLGGGRGRLPAPEPHHELLGGDQTRGVAGAASAAPSAASGRQAEPDWRRLPRRGLEFRTAHRRAPSRRIVPGATKGALPIYNRTRRPSLRHSCQRTAAFTNSLCTRTAGCTKQLCVTPLKA